MVSAELAAFIETGVAALGASRSDDGEPEAFRVWGAAVADDGRLRVICTSDGGHALDDLRSNGHLAVTFTDILTFRSVQVKGRVDGAVDPPGPADLELMRRYGAAFQANLAAIGHPPALGLSLQPLAAFAVWVVVEELYDQTPGRRAGAELDAARWEGVRSRGRP